MKKTNKFSIDLNYLLKKDELTVLKGGTNKLGYLKCSRSWILGGDCSDYTNCDNAYLWCATQCFGFDSYICVGPLE
jgi:hypothetical protein